MSEEVEKIEYELRPLNGYMLVKRDGSETKSPSGIIFPDASVEPSRQGVVSHVGWHESQQIEHQVKPGDRVLLPRHGGITVQHDDQEFTLIQEEDIIARLVKPAPDNG